MAIREENVNKKVNLLLQANTEVLHMRLFCLQMVSVGKKYCNVKSDEDDKILKK